MAQGDGKTGSGGQEPSLGLTQPNFGAKYDQHVSQLQTALEEAQSRVEAMQKTSDELRSVADSSTPFALVQVRMESADGTMPVHSSVQMCSTFCSCCSYIPQILQGSSAGRAG